MQQKHAGFTLIEIMVVVVILAILASTLVPKIMDRPEQARIVKAKQDILAIESALDLYRLDNGRYPTQAQGLQALVEHPTTDPQPEMWRRYLKKLPQDPWGKAYHYKNPGEHGEIDIFSFGANNKNAPENAMINNWG